MTKSKYGFTRKNDVAAIVGFATSTRGNTPWNNPKIDVWGLNEEMVWSVDNPECPKEMGWWRQKPENVAGWFQLHSWDTCERREGNHNDPKHPDWLRKEHPFPVFMQQRFSEYPSSVKFPIEDIQKEFLTPDGRKYATSSIVYIMGFLYLLGYKRIELYGFDMASETEYRYQRPCASWMAGRLRGRGITVYVPPMGSFLCGPSYAYEDMLIGWRQDMETNAAKLTKVIEKESSELEGGQGALEAFTDAKKLHPEVSKKGDKFFESHVDREEKLAIAKGKRQGLTFAMRLYDVYSHLTDSVGE
jgi:hypothetical protein